MCVQAILVAHPLALAAWRALPDPPPHIRAVSAGLWASDGAPAASHTQSIACDWGVDLSSHHAQTLNTQLIQETHLFCVMTPEHADLLRTHFRVSGRVVLLGSFARVNPSRNTNSLLNGQNDSEQTLSELWDDSYQASSEDAILDPFGCSHEAYATCAAQIRRAVAGLAESLRNGTLSL